MAAKEAIQCPGFWWCAWGSTSSLGPGGLRSLGVCVELLLVVVTSSLLPPASAELQKAQRERGKCKWNQNSVTVDNANDDDDDDDGDTDVVHVWCGDKLTPDAHVRTVGVVCLCLFRGLNPNKSFSLLTDSIWRAETFSVSGLTQFASKTLEKFHLVLFVFLFLYVVFVWAFSSVFSLVCCFFFWLFLFPSFGSATVMKHVK